MNKIASYANSSQSVETVTIMPSSFEILSLDTSSNEFLIPNLGFHLSLPNLPLIRIVLRLNWNCLLQKTQIFQIQLMLGNLKQTLINTQFV